MCVFVLEVLLEVVAGIFAESVYLFNLSAKGAHGSPKVSK